VIINDVYMFKDEDEMWKEGGFVYSNEKFNVKSKGN